MNDIKISGSGKISGGEYDAISVSGSAKISGSIGCSEMKVSGSCKVEGDVFCRGDVRVSGSCKIDGSVTAENSLHVSGSFVCEGNLKAGKIAASGGITINKNISASSVEISGGIKVGGDISGEQVELRGCADIGGLLNAEQVSIELDGTGINKSEIESIGGGTITVKRRGEGKWGIFGVWNKNYPTLNVKGSIEGDSISLTDTSASVVRGKNVAICENCRIGRVEYSEGYTVSEGSQVGEAVKI